MIEKLEGFNSEHAIQEKLNELIDAFNTHYHMQAEYGLVNYDLGYRSSSPRLEEKDESLPSS